MTECAMAANTTQPSGERLGENDVGQHLAGVAFDLLDRREDLIIRAYFGLDDQATLTLEQIGTRLGLTRERVRQLRDRALSKMRDCCGDRLAELSTN